MQVSRLFWAAGIAGAFVACGGKTGTDTNQDRSVDPTGDAAAQWDGGASSGGASATTGGATVSTGGTGPSTGWTFTGSAGASGTGGMPPDIRYDEEAGCYPAVSGQNRQGPPDPECPCISLENLGQLGSCRTRGTTCHYRHGQHCWVDSCDCTTSDDASLEWRCTRLFC